MSLPTGTVTFLFTDIEGSTRLWEQYPEPMRAVLARHNVLLHEAIAAHEGAVFKTVGDAFCAAFSSAPAALLAALTAQQSLRTEPWPTVVTLSIRIALHTGLADVQDGDYFGPPLNRVARLLSSGYGGQTLLSQAVYELTRDALPPNCTLRDLGSHALRDLARPEQVYQLCHPDLLSQFSPLKSLDTLPNNLPRQVTSFVGREKELTQIKTLLAKTDLLTLTGSGGCGKSRLSLQAAADVLDTFPDGVWLVELAPIADPAIVPQAVAGVLGVVEQPGKTMMQTLTDSLKAKTLLLVLDNCEHVLSACAKLADALIRTCPHVKILASSREGLGIAGEQTYRVPSLDLPDTKITQTPGSLSQYEAVRLFIERAASVKSDFAITNANAPSLASMCHRLDGIPLAIELAAARVRSLSVEEINAKLDNRFRLLTGGSKTALPRQQTLRALIDWSYDLLTAQEKALMVRLSVFMGGWTLAAAEAVCASSDVEDWEMLDLLTSLADKSLVIAEEQDGATRYRFLETVRQYSRDRLAESEDALEIRGRHRDYFLQWAEEIRPKLIRAEQGQWLSVLETEHDNLRQALTFCLEDPESGHQGLRLGSSLQQFWIIRGHLREGREWLTALLSRPQAQGHTIARADALSGAAHLAVSQGDYAVAPSLLEEAIAIYRELGNRHGIASCLGSLGGVASDQGDYASARTLYEESLAIRRELGDRDGIAGILGSLGWMVQRQGDYASARTLYEESLAIRRELENKLALAGCLSSLGWLVHHQGDLELAWSLQQEGLTIRRELRHRQGIAQSLNYLANLAQSQGNLDLAWSLHQESLTIKRELGDRDGIADSLGNLGVVAQSQGNYAVARALGQEGAAIYREVGNRYDLANALNNIGNAASSQSDYASARTLYEESLAIRRELGDQPGIAGSLNAQGWLTSGQGDYRTARSQFEESLALFRELGIKIGTALSLFGLALMARLQGDDVTEVRSLLVEGLTLLQETGYKVGIAIGLEGFASLAVSEGTGDKAARIFGAAEALREAIDVPITPNWYTEYHRRVAAAQATLDPETFASAWAEGRAMTWEQAAAYALAE